MHRARLHITGASGSGTTTLAMAVASAWSVPHADTDDYFWAPTDPPFVHQRPERDRVELMQQVFARRASWVLSGSMVTSELNEQGQTAGGQGQSEVAVSPLP